MSIQATTLVPIKH